MLKKELIYYLVITCVTSSTLEAVQHPHDPYQEGRSQRSIKLDYDNNLKGDSEETSFMPSHSRASLSGPDRDIESQQNLGNQSHFSGWLRGLCSVAGGIILGGAVIGGAKFILNDTSNVPAVPNGIDLPNMPIQVLPLIANAPDRKTKEQLRREKHLERSEKSSLKNYPYTKPASQPMSKNQTLQGENIQNTTTPTPATTKNSDDCSYADGTVRGSYQCVEGHWKKIEPSSTLTTSKAGRKRLNKNKKNRRTSTSTTPTATKKSDTCSHADGTIVGSYKCVEGHLKKIEPSSTPTTPKAGWKRLKETEQNGYKVFIDARVVDDKNQIVSDAPSDPVEKFHDVRWTDVRHQFDCGSQRAYEGQQCQMKFDGKWHESPVTSSDPNCSYTQKISCHENLNLQNADCWLKECPGEDLRGEIWEPGKRFQISYQYDWEAHMKTWPHTADSGSVALPKDLREICSDQIMLWPKHVLGLQKNSKPYLIHASIGTFPNKGTTKDSNTSGGPEKFTTNQEVIEGNIWLQESHFKDRLGKGEGLCSHEFGHFFIAPQNPLFKLWSVKEGEKISFKGPKVMKYFGGSAPLGDAAHWEQYMKHAETGEAISGLPMSGSLHNWEISDLTLWALEDMGVETTVSKNRNQG